MLAIYLDSKQILPKEPTCAQPGQKMPRSEREDSLNTDIRIASKDTKEHPLKENSEFIIKMKYAHIKAIENLSSAQQCEHLNKYWIYLMTNWILNIKFDIKQNVLPHYSK